MAHLPRAVARHDDRGATTVEYVGIVALVVILAVSVFALITPVRDQSKAVLDKAYCKISSALGGAACNNADLPTYIPRVCQISSTQKDYGGSVSLVVTVGGDTGYTLYRIRTRQDDGSYKDVYVVKTNGKASAGLNLGEPGAEVDTGSGSGGESNSVTVEGSFATGSNYSFKTQKDAEDFVNKYKDQWGALGGSVDGAPASDSTYYELGGKASLESENGKFKASGSGEAVLGLEKFKNGDKKYSLALTASAALELGIPVPKSIIQANASGEAKVAVQADVTFDKHGNIKEIAGQVGVKAQAALDLGKKDPYQPKHAAKKKAELKDLQLPTLPVLDAGASATLSFKTEFKDPNRIHQLSGALGNLVTGGSLTPEQQAAVTDQINNDSQVTFNLDSYSHDEQKIGGKVHFIITVGAEGHINTTEETVMNGWYYNPQQSTWEQNVACKGAK